MMGKYVNSCPKFINLSQGSALTYPSNTKKTSKSNQKIP